MLKIMAILGLLRASYQHKCVHDEFFKNLKLSKTSEYQTEAQASPDTSPNRVLFDPPNYYKTKKRQMRIEINYEYSDEFIKKYPDLAVVYEMSKRILKNVKNFFESRVNVTTTDELVFKNGLNCNGLVVKPFKKKIDLYVVIKAEIDKKTEYFAAATSCILSTETNRPIVGIYYLNFAKMSFTQIREYYYFSTFAHEFTHILGFNNDLFGSYIHPNGTAIPKESVVQTASINGVEYTMLVLPKLVEFAKDHFDCDKLTGIPLENGGGAGSAGSHWEKSFFPNEYMNPTIENPGVISEFTFTLLNNTGWYNVRQGLTSPRLRSPKGQLRGMRVARMRAVSCLRPAPWAGSTALMGRLGMRCAPLPT